MTITDSTFTNNKAGTGGAINNGGTLNVHRCTFDSNQSNASATGASIGGGAIRISGNQANIDLSTFANNSATNNGGAILIETATNLFSCTLFKNSAPNGGAIDNESAALTLGNTILNAGSQGVNLLNNGTLTDSGYNLSSDTSGPNNGSTDKISTNPNLGTLQINAPGTTPTHALLSGSPAIDAGGTPLTLDQRGITRPQGANDDIGAYEVVFTAPTNTAPVNGTVTPNAATDAPNTPRSFIATYSDAQGANDINLVALRIGGTTGTGGSSANNANSVNNANAMVCVYTVQNGKVYLFDDAGAYVPQAAFPGTGVVLSNSQGSLNAANTTVTSSGTTLTVKWAVKAKASFVGTRSIALICRDRGGLGDGYDTFGTWTITNPAPSVPAQSQVSTATASEQGINLVFTGAAPQSGYAVTVNGAPVDVTSASVKGDKVALQVAQTLQSGDKVVVTWPNGSTRLTAN